MPKYYLVFVWGCVDPTVVNSQEPCDSYEELLSFARKFVHEDGFKSEESIVFWQHLDDENGLTAGSFTSAELWPEENV